MRCESLHDNQILRMVTMNVVSDALWAYLSADGSDIKFKHTNQINYSLNGQLAAQVIYPTLGATFCGFGMLLAYKYGLQKEPPLLETFAVCSVTAAVIAMWNYVQPKAVELFKSLGYSQESAGYLSSIFTGLTEGSMSYALTKLIRMLADSKEYSEFRNNPQQYLIDWFLKLGLNVTIGAISGAVWQLVFNALMIANANALITALAVVLSAAFATTCSMLVINAITQSNSYRNCVGLHAPSEAQIYKAPLQCCIGFFGCGKSSVSDPSSDVANNAASESLLTETSGAHDPKRLFFNETPDASKNPVVSGSFGSTHAASSAAPGALVASRVSLGIAAELSAPASRQGSGELVPLSSCASEQPHYNSTM